MAKEIRIDIPDDVDVDALLAKAGEAARNNGIALTGDANGGAFKGMAEGSYTVEDRTLVVNITKKPALAPWSMVETAVRRVFG